MLCVHLNNKMTIHITINQLSQVLPRQTKKILGYMGKTEPDDEMLDMISVLDFTELDDVLWILKYIQDKEVVDIVKQYCIGCVKFVEDVFQQYPELVEAIATAERFARGEETDDVITMFKKIINSQYMYKEFPYNDPQWHSLNVLARPIRSCLHFAPWSTAWGVRNIVTDTRNLTKLGITPEKSITETIKWQEDEFRKMFA